MTRGFEERIAAAYRATIAAATHVRTMIASELDAMAIGWERATNEADDLAAQRAALSAVAGAYNTELEKFWSIFPAGRPTDSRMTAERSWKARQLSETRPGLC
jgi:hypothetical protein